MQARVALSLSHFLLHPVCVNEIAVSRVHDYSQVLTELWCPRVRQQAPLQASTWDASDGRRHRLLVRLRPRLRLHRVYLKHETWRSGPPLTAKHRQLPDHTRGELELAKVAENAQAAGRRGGSSRAHELARERPQERHGLLPMAQQHGAARDHIRAASSLAHLLEDIVGVHHELVDDAWTAARAEHRRDVGDMRRRLGAGRSPALEIFG